MIKLAKEIDVETLASIIRRGILNGSVNLVGHEYLQVIVILFNRYPDLISFKDSGNTLVDFKVKRSFYDVLKKEDTILYKCLLDPYAIMKDLKVNVPRTLVDGLYWIVNELKKFNGSDVLIGALGAMDKRLMTDPYTQFEMIKQGKEDFATLIGERFFLDVAEKLEQSDSSIVEIVKQTFLQLVYDHIAEIKLYTERNYHVTLHSVMGTGIVYKIYAAINNAKDTFKPFEVVPYDVFESDFVSYALQTLQHTGNFGIAVKILDTAFVVVVPSNRLDIVKC